MSSDAEDESFKLGLFLGGQNFNKRFKFLDERAKKATTSQQRIQPVSRRPVIVHEIAVGVVPEHLKWAATELK